MNDFSLHWELLAEWKSQYRQPRAHGPLRMALPEAILERVRAENAAREARGEMPLRDFSESVDAVLPQDSPQWVGDAQHEFMRFAERNRELRLDEYPFGGTKRVGRRGRVKGAAAGPMLGAYRVVEACAEGGMGLIFKATHADGGFYAVKVIAPTWVRKIERSKQTGIPLPPGLTRLSERFHRERDVHARLRHEHIVKYHGSFDDPCPGMATTYVEGPSLANLLDHFTGTPVPLATAVDLIGQLAAALAAAHKENVVHRDLSPRNALLSFDPPVGRDTGRCRLALNDFGLAVIVDGERYTIFAEEDVWKGSPQYQSPEHAPNAGIGRHSDVFVMGIIAYELLTGHHPFLGGSRYERSDESPSFSDPVPLRERCDAVPEELNTFVLRMLRRETVARPRASDVAERFRDYHRLLSRTPVTGSSGAVGAGGESAGARADGGQGSGERTQPSDVSELIDRLNQCLSPLPKSTFALLKQSVAGLLDEPTRLFVLLERLPPDARDRLRLTLGADLDFTADVRAQLKTLADAARHRVKTAVAGVWNVSPAALDTLGMLSPHQLAATAVQHCSPEGFLDALNGLAARRAVDRDHLGALAEIVCHHVTLYVDVTADDRDRMGSPSRLRLLEGRASNHIMAELIAARLAGTPAKFALRSMRSVASMVGEYALYYRSNPDFDPVGAGDPQASFDQGALYLANDILSVTGLGPPEYWDAISDESVERNRQLVCRPDQLAPELKRTLFHLQESIDQESRYAGRPMYFSIPLPDEQYDRENLVRTLAVLSAAVPNLVFIELLPSPADGDPHFAVARLLHRFLRSAEDRCHAD
ncbi:MAG TPA: serine/threonine-protein kinase [Urbifossiella sp.]|jgi:serine/threonine protein kinase|nr:serine/threonine-protein kinase [Urbifossiella sp.]